MARYLEPEKIDAIYVSPQQRAIETARPLADVFGHTPTVVDGLAEFDIGHSSYIPGEEAPPLTGPQLDRLLALVTGDPFRSRVHNAVTTIIDTHPGETIAAVCHGGVISSILADLLGVDAAMYFDSHYTSVTRLKASTNGRKSMASFNECHWLREL